MSETKSKSFTLPWYCCNQKAWVASVQSFTLWQQATIETTCHGEGAPLLLICAIYMWVLFFTHPVHGTGELHMQRNTNWEVAASIYIHSSHLYTRYYISTFVYITLLHYYISKFVSCYMDLQFAVVSHTSSFRILSCSKIKWKWL